MDEIRGPQFSERGKSFRSCINARVYSVFNDSKQMISETSSWMCCSKAEKTEQLLLIRCARPDDHWDALYKIVFMAGYHDFAHRRSDDFPLSPPCHKSA